MTFEQLSIGPYQVKTNNGGKNFGRSEQISMRLVTGLTKVGEKNKQNKVKKTEINKETKTQRNNEKINKTK
jgi:hypothetical protein